MIEGFTYGARSSRDYALRVEKLPAIMSPKRRVTVQQIPGRNGALHMDEGVFEVYTQPYACYFHTNDPTPKQAHGIKAWLMGSCGPHRLIDEYDPEHYHRACFIGPLDVDNILGKYGRCVINFELDPRAFLLSGDEPIMLHSPDVITNLTGFTAQPLLRVYHTGGDGALTVGSREVTLTGLDGGELWLDCEAMTAYNDAGSANSSVGCIEYPELAPGDNAVSWSGCVTAVELIPRWWEL